MDILFNILGFFVVVFGVLDGLKYHWLAESIKKAKTARGQSRKFVNAAIGKDLVLFAYLAFKPDWYLILMTFIGFIFTVELLFTIYNFYPYRYRNLLNFKKPNFFIYLINSLQLNCFRKRL
jgi:hypothetical protein